MKREDFKEILPVHVDNCKKIIKQKGECTGVDCKECPFTFFNSTNEKDFEPEKKLGEEIKKDVEKTARAICEATPGRIKTVEDDVNQPNHYKLDGLDVEVLDVIKAVLSKEEFEGFLHGNVIKYTLRTNKKNGVKDLEKAHKYLGWLIESRKE